jgi:hypothetical protein
MNFAAIALLFSRQETADEVGDFVGGCVEGEVARVEDLNFGVRDVATCI